jgi:hypothetical protein
VSRIVSADEETAIPLHSGAMKSGRSASQPQKVADFVIEAAASLGAIAAAAAHEGTQAVSFGAPKSGPNALGGVLEKFQWPWILARRLLWGRIRRLGHF